MLDKPSCDSINRRRLLGRLASAVAACSWPGFSAFAQGYPDRPIHLYVGYPAGGGTDFVARMVGFKLSAVLGQQVVVMNLPGATGAIAVERVVHSPPDGYTLLVIATADTILPALRAKLPYDFDRDLVPVARAVSGAYGLVVTPSLPVRTVKELIALAQSQPDKLNYGSPGIGNNQHLAGEFFNQLAKVKIMHVPFKGGAEAIKATVAGDIQMTFASLAPALPLVEAGKLRLLAVTPAVRSASVPATPTMAEAGVPGYARSSWFGVVAPAGTPKEIVVRLNSAITRAMQTPESRETLMKQGLEFQASTQEEFAAFVRAELAQNARLVREMGIKAD